MTKNDGTKTTARQVEASMPLATAIPRECREAAPAPRREAPVTGHDATFWPTVRADMTDRDLIRRRMAEDLFPLFEAQGEDATISERDLRRLGWLPEQVAAHGPGALDAARLRWEKRTLAQAWRS